MRAKVRFWLVLGVLLTAGVVILQWKQGSEKSIAVVTRDTRAPAPILATTPAVLAAHLGKVLPGETKTNRAKYQLSNVPDSIEVLAKRDSAVLMRNALIDTKADLNLAIPAHLRASADPGSYIVQFAGVKAGEFQKMLKAAGAEVVAYVPNNAYLVKAGAAVASGLQGKAGVWAVLPYEPYYKIDTRLMKLAIAQEAFDAEQWLRVTLFPGADLDTLKGLSKATATKEASPFGDQILIQPQSDALAKLAQLPGVQLIEPWNPRVMANDLTRVRLGIAEDTLTNRNYMDLTGSNVWVNINDMGVDGTHQELTNRVFYHGTNAMIDLEGHGTHVAATIAGNGLGTNVFDTRYTETNSYRLTTNVVRVDDADVTTVTIDGSLTNASMRGMAPQARLFALPIDFDSAVSTPVTDSFLIETAARTNYVALGRSETLISNNSWNWANTPDYDSQAARFDAAARDAIVEMTGQQPVMYVFAAGNYGFGNEDGLEGEPGMISSPGTAKNVLTIGALETPRFMVEGLTNIVVQTEGTNSVTNTNVVQIFLRSTDSANQVASYSSRGNVGILTEGAFGRFKPDLVAPGSFILSARSKDWKLTNDFNPAASETMSNIFNVMERNNAISTKYRYDSGTSFSAPGVSGMLALVQEFFSSKLPAPLRRNLSPALMKALLINSARSVHEQYDYQVQNTINYQGWGLVSLPTMLHTNMLTAPENDWYVRMVDQSPTNAVGTGDAVSWTLSLDPNAVLSGLRFTLVWTDPPGNPSVATKLVNDLDLVVEFGGYMYHGNDILQGSTGTEAREWIDLTDRFHSLYRDRTYSDFVNNVENVFVGGTGSTNNTNVTIHVIGRRVNVKAISEGFTTTGSTDEIKQDFALVVSSGYRGAETNAQATPIPPFKEFRLNGSTFFNAQSIVTMTNGVPLMNQRVGANSPLRPNFLNREQWNFYVFTNDNANVSGVNTNQAGEYLAFVTFTPPNLSIPRTLEADIDMYVSKNPGLTNLSPAVLAAPNTYRSIGRLGTEQVIFQPSLIISNEFGPTTNLAKAYDPAHPEEGGVIPGVAKLNDVFYIAIKSEDQQGAEFSFMAVSSGQPFQEERNGKTVLTVTPLSAFIPDGTPNAPSAAIGIALGVTDTRILDATVAMAVSHEDLGDLLGTLRHNNTRSILNNHTLNNQNFSGTNSFIFTDDPYVDRSTAPDVNSYPVNLFGPLTTQNYRSSDGPGDLMGYSGTRLSGPWLFEMIDSAATHTGRVERMEVQITPIQRELPFGETIRDTVNPFGRNFYLIDVPPNASRITIVLNQTENLPANPLELIVGRDTVPSTNGGNYDFYKVIADPSPSVAITIDATTFPPLTAGEYFVGVLNPWPVATDFELTVILELASDGNLVNAGQSNVPLTDDARKYSTVRIDEDKVVTGASVAIVTENGLVSDYAFRLTSPQGTTIVLSENRGGLNTNGFGSTAVTTNAQGAVFTGPSYAIFTDEPLAELPIKFAPPPFGDSSSSRGPIVGDGFDGMAEGFFTAPGSFGVWRVDSNSVAVVNRPDAHSLTNYLDLLSGAISTTAPTINGRTYKLSFAYRSGSAPNSIFNTGVADDNTLESQGVRDRHYRLVQTADPSFVGSDLFVAQTNDPPFPTWFRGGTNSQWISLMHSRDGGHPPGRYVFRTSFVWTNATLGTLVIRLATDRVAISPDSGGATVSVNGGAGLFVPDGPSGFSPPFTMPLRVGVNTVDFIMDRNAPGSIGLRAELSVTGFSSDASRDFSHVNNPNGVWTYGYEFGGVYTRMLTASRVNTAPDVWFWQGFPGSAGFGEPTIGKNEGTNTWVIRGGISDTYYYPGTFALHPGAQNQRATLRWTAPTAGTYQVDAFFRGGDSITRTDARVARAGAPLWTGNVTGTALGVGYSAPVLVAAGQTLDFSVGWGSDNSYLFDTTAARVTVMQAPPTNNPSMIPATGWVRLTGAETNAFNLVGGRDWKIFETEFIADTNDMRLQFLADASAPGLEIDTIKFEDTGTVFLQPEEPLALLEGERAMGEWKLEAWDNRTGLSSVIRDWQIILSTATAVLPAEALRNFQFFPQTINAPAVSSATYFTPGVLRRGETQVFYYDICPDTKNLAVQVIPFATVSATNSATPIQMMIDRTGFPTGNPELDDYQMLEAVGNTPAVMILRTNEPAAAPLRPGTRLFIAVRNEDFLSTNSFQLFFIADGTCVFTPPLPLRVNSTLNYWAPSSELTDQGASFSFAASGESSVEFNTDGAGDLVAVASAHGDPSLTDFEIREEISATTGTLNLPGAGSWRIRVFNASENNVRYSLTARGSAGFEILESRVGSDGVFRMIWQSLPGLDYEVLISSNLTDWSPIATVSAEATTASYSETVDREQKNRFYQVRVKATGE